MPHCNQCGRKAGGFSLRSYVEETGRCDECEQETTKRVEAALEGLRQELQDRLKKGNLVQSDWTAIENHARTDGLNIAKDFVYIRSDLRQAMKAAIKGKPDLLSKSDDRLFDLIVQQFSLPEYCHDLARQDISSIRPAAVFCVHCGAGVIGESSAPFFTCSACNVRAVMATCPHCSSFIQIQEKQWNHAVKCVKCGRVSGWDTWNKSRITMGAFARILDQAQTEVADASRRTVSGIVLAGSAYSLNVGGYSLLEFAAGRVAIWKFIGNSYQQVATSSYSDVNSLQIGGRGAVTTGGGWIGGGFGLTGIVTGALIASALNKTTTRHSIETIIYFQTMVGEVILLNNQYAPEYLRILLSPAFSRIEAAHRTATTPPVSVIDQLRELGQLREKGTVTEEEFQKLKANLLKPT